VTWNQDGLLIRAKDSSLNDILRQIAVNTGARVEGVGQDQRVFGVYGPGPRSEVLWKLLEGSGYNLLLTGGRAADRPLRIVLSVRPPVITQTLSEVAGSSHPQQPAEAVKFKPLIEDSTTVSAPVPNANPYSNGAPVQDPRQLMQEIVQRQRKIDHSALAAPGK